MGDIMNLEGLRNSWQTHIISSEEAGAQKKLKREKEGRNKVKIYSAISKAELILCIAGQVKSRLVPSSTVVSNPLKLGHLGLCDQHGRSYAFASVAKQQKSEFSDHEFPVDGLSVYFYAGKPRGESLEIFDISKWSPNLDQTNNPIDPLDERLDFLLGVIEEMPTHSEHSE